VCVTETSTRPLPPPYSPYYGPPPPPTPPRRSKAFVASVMAGVLLVGGAAGLGGAAAWSALEDEPAATTSTNGTRVASDTSDAPEPALDGSVEAVAAKVLPSVVKIDVTGAQGSGSGSGIILSEDGQILTNEHVVALADGEGTVRVHFNDGSSADAEVVGTDPLTDTAVIQATDVSGLTPATIGESSGLAIGQAVVAIGSPFGLESTVTSGIVSALNRPVQVASDGQGNSTTYPAIQTDAAINPGNSGGALVDLSGNVVGINSSIRTASGSSESGSIGLGFAIPIDEVMPIVDQMANGETPTHARLGITVGDATGDVVGAEIGEVTDGSTAAEAGLEPGDVITKVDDKLITGADSLVATIRSYRPGDTVTLTWVRDGEEQSTELELDSDGE
jgi:putative serine protease PepD